MKKIEAQEKRIVFVSTFRFAEQFYVPNTKKQSKMGKIQKLTDNHLSFDGMIQENIDLSDIYQTCHY